MYDPEYQRNYFKRRYAQDPEFRAHRQQLSNDYRWERYASDPEFRGRCLEASRKCRLKQRHGITVGQYDAQLAAQNGACACCHSKLGRAVRIDHPVKDTIALLCVGCSRRVASLRHVREHAGAFEAYMKQWGMTVQLGRFYEIMRRCGWTPAQGDAEGRTS
jgi:hypothetical protein